MGVKVSFCSGVTEHTTYSSYCSLVYAVSRNFDGNGRCSRKQRGQRGQPGGVHSTYRINRGDYSLFLKLSKEIKWSVIDYVKPDLCMAGYVCRPVC